jgi:hypothetical protein
MLTPKAVNETTPIVVGHIEQRHELGDRRKRRIAERARLLDARRVERAAA